MIAIAKSASTGVERIGDAIAELERKSDFGRADREAVFEIGNQTRSGVAARCGR